MSTIYLRHIITSCNMKAIRRRLNELLDFDPQIVDTKNEYPLLSDAEDMGYSSNYAYLQDRFMGYYAKHDRELEEGEKEIYGYDDRESECIHFALESLIEYLQKQTEDRLDYSIKIYGDVVSAVITAHIYD